MANVITGNPGVGKHSITKKIAKKLEIEIIDINKIVIETGLFEKKAESLDVNINELKKIMAKRIPRNSIIVGHLAPYIIPKKQVETAIVLRKNPYELTLIYKKRKYSNQKQLDNLGSEILGIVSYDTIRKFGRDKTFEINVSSRSTSSTIKKIISVFNRKSRGDIIDWLSLVGERNDLNKFFSH